MATPPRSPLLYQVISAGQRLTFAKGEMITSTDEDTHVILLASGYVKGYSIAASGAHYNQTLYTTYDILPMTKVYRELCHFKLYTGPETFYYMAMSETQVFRLGLDRLSAAVEQDGRLYRELFREAGQLLKPLIQHAEGVSLANSVARVAHELLFLTQEFSCQVNGGIELKVPMTHQYLAETLNMTRTTVTLAITLLRRQGILSDGRHLMIMDIDRLRQAAYAR